jgi:hypothetical protein
MTHGEVSFDPASAVGRYYSCSPVGEVGLRVTIQPRLTAGMAYPATDNSRTNFFAKPILYGLALPAMKNTPRPNETSAASGTL